MSKCGVSALAINPSSSPLSMASSNRIVPTADEESANATKGFTAPAGGVVLPKCLNICCWAYQAKADDLVGYILNPCARTVSAMCQVFLMSALLYFANLAAGCSSKGAACSNDDALWVANSTNTSLLFGGGGDATSCGRVYGMRPDNLVSTIPLIGAWLNIFILPVAGAMLDNTPHRHAAGRWSCAIMILANAIQAGISEDTWLMMGIMQAVVCPTTYMIHWICAMAYMTELTSDLDNDLPRINSFARAVELSMMLTFILVVGIFSFVLGVVDLARASQVIAVLIAVPFSYASWNAYTPRAAVHQLPPGVSVVMAGFKGVFQNLAMVKKDYPELLNFFLSYMVYEAANSAILTLCIIYIQEQLCVESITAFFVPSVMFAILGALFSQTVTKLCGGRPDETDSTQLSASASGTRSSLLAAIATMGAINVLGPMIFYSPAHAGISPILGVVAGFVLGWIYPTQRNFFGLLLPPGHEAACVGLFQSFAGLLAWAPYVVSIAIKENDGLSRTTAARLGWGSVTIFYIIGFIGIASIDMKSGMERVKKRIEIRRG